MRYTGGKERIAVHIIKEIKRARDGLTTYYEPFLGGASVASRAAPLFDRVVLGDAMPDVVKVWQAAQRGWVPPTEVSEEEYATWRATEEPSPMRGFVGFACSFAGKWYGGYARDDKRANPPRQAAAEGSRSVVKKAATLGKALILCQDYSLGKPEGPCLVYCDPPYRGTLGYAGAGTFDSDRFWRVAEAWSVEGNRVLVSEYAAPDGWVSVWQKQRQVSTSLNNKSATALEQLWVHGSQIEGHPLAPDAWDASKAEWEADEIDVYHQRMQALRGELYDNTKETS